jgi:hypothetical protein
LAGCNVIIAEGLDIFTNSYPVTSATPTTQREQTQDKHKKNKKKRQQQTFESHGIVSRSPNKYLLASDFAMVFPPSSSISRTPSRRDRSDQPSPSSCS